MDVQWLSNLFQPEKGNGPFSTGNLGLRPGTLLNASVLEVEKGHDALLTFGKFKAYARLPLPVVSGQTIQIQVQQGDPAPRMVMLSPSGKQMAPPPPPRGNADAATTTPQTAPHSGGKAVLNVLQSNTPLELPRIETQGGTAATLPAENRAFQTLAPLPELDKNTPQAKAGAFAPFPEPNSPNDPHNEKLEIKLFEPVPDRVSLNAHARELQPGQALEGRVTGFSKDGQMLVDFGKFKAFTKIDVPVREGQVLHLAVEKTDQGIALSLRGAGAREMVGLPPRTQTVQPSAPPQAESVPADGRALADNAEKTQPNPASPLNGQAVERAVSHPVQPLPMTVGATPATAREITRLGERIGQLLDPANGMQKSTMASLPPTAQDALAHLKTLLQPAVPAGDTAELMARIKDFVEHSGIYFEKRLETVIKTLQDRPTPLPPSELAQQPAVRELIATDVKPNLMVLKEFLDSQNLEQRQDERHLLETMKHAVERTLAHIEQQQHGATQRPGDPDLSQAFSHLLVIADHEKEARLKVYYAKKGRREEGGKIPRVALLLEMDRLGTVRTDLWMVGKDLNITFFVETEEARAAINAEQGEIKSALKKRFNTIAVNTLVNKHKIEEFDETDISPITQRLLDLTI